MFSVFYKVFGMDSFIHVKDTFFSYSDVCAFCVKLYGNEKVEFIRAYRTNNPAKRVLLLTR